MQRAKLNSEVNLVRQNVSIVKKLYPELPNQGLTALRELTRTLRLSVLRREILHLDSGWYITHAGLLRIAQRRRCLGIRTILEKSFCDPAAGRWVFRAIVYKNLSSRGFMGYGDADPLNTSGVIRGAEMRVAETRAVNRALRKAYGIGLCSVEELGWQPNSFGQSDDLKSAAPSTNNSHHGGAPRLRDRLCLLIRQHGLDANLVKAYAADFCGTPNLRDASREQIEQFITHLADWATRDRAALICKLNSYAPLQEVRP